MRCKARVVASNLGVFTSQGLDISIMSDIYSHELIAICLLMYGKDTPRPREVRDRCTACGRPLALLHYLVKINPLRQPRKKLNTLESTLTLDRLLCKFLVQCSLQICSGFFWHEVPQVHAVFTRV